MMIEFETRAKTSPHEVAVLIRAVVAAQDWAQITKPAGTLLKRADFERAWGELIQLGAPHTAQLGEPAVR
jgi:hypothetical protein